VKGKKN